VVTVNLENLNFRKLSPESLGGKSPGAHGLNLVRGKKTLAEIGQLRVGGDCPPRGCSALEKPAVDFPL